MQLSDLEYHLPSELIAQNPIEPRDEARLLVYERKTDQTTHSLVKNLPDFLDSNYLIVANNSKVRRARLLGQNEQAKSIEILILEPLSIGFECLLGGFKPKIDSWLSFGEGFFWGKIIKQIPDPNMSTFQVEFYGKDQKEKLSGLELDLLLETYGQVPLPPYIHQSNSQAERYQTIFAKELGSAAAPTAGLHFTPELISHLDNQGIDWLEVTLHVGLGTFLPLRQSEIAQNRLHTEQTFISESTATLLNKTNKKILSIGTTSTRTLEAHTQNGEVKSGWQATNIFIYPPYKFQTVDALLTNFHLPHSSLMLLVAAFIGQDQLDANQAILKLKELYQLAISEQYRFFSFGDAMLVL